MKKFGKHTKISEFQFTLEQLFSYNTVTPPPKDEVIKIIDSYKEREIINSKFVEYSYFNCFEKYFWVHKLLVKNLDQTYTQVSIVFWEGAGATFDIEKTDNIIVVYAIWESEIKFSDISEKSKHFHSGNFTNNYLEDLDQVNHFDHFFYFPIHKQEVFIIYYQLIGGCNIRSMINKLRPEHNDRENYILTLDIKDWLVYDFNQIFIHNGCLIGTANALNVELPLSELFENKHLFSGIMETESIGNDSKRGTLESYHISIGNGLLIMFHSYDYYQGDNPIDYQLISKIKLIDLMNYNQIHSTLKVD